MTHTENFIHWGPALMTGIASIDEQHRVLVDMCNEAHELVHTGASAETTKRILRDLMSYALYHFDTEEELAIDCGYAAALVAQNEDHRAQHRAFSSAVADMQMDMSRGNAISVSDLFTFLRDWLTQHIQGTDMKLADFIKAQNQQAR